MRHFSLDYHYGCTDNCDNPDSVENCFKDRENDPDVYASSELIEDYEKIEQNEKLAQKVLEQS